MNDIILETRDVNTVRHK